MTNSWYVVTGGPSTGKTTLLTRLEELGHKTIPEAARLIIDEGVARGLSVEQIRADEKKFQDDVMHRKLEVEASLKPKLLTFFDRGLHDTAAYLHYYDFEIDEWIENALKGRKYQKVFLLEPLKTFTDDYARIEIADFAGKIQQLLFDAYDQAGMKPIRVPAVSVDERVRFILRVIEG